MLIVVPELLIIKRSTEEWPQALMCLIETSKSSWGETLANAPLLINCVTCSSVWTAEFIGLKKVCSR